jgi:hypothetical protein
MTLALKRLIEKILSSNGTLTTDQILQHAADAGHPHLKKRELSEFLQRAECNSWVQQSDIPNRREKGWTLTEKRKQDLGLVPKPADSVPKSPSTKHPQLLEQLRRRGGNVVRIFQSVMPNFPRQLPCCER